MAPFFVAGRRSLNNLSDSNTIGYMSAFASVEYATSVQILAAVTIGSGGTFLPTTGQI